MSRAWILKLPPRKQTKVCVDCYNKCFFCRRINRPPLFWMPPIKLLVISSFEYTTTIYHPFILDLIKGLDIVEQDNNSVFCFQVVTMPVTQAYTRMTQILIVMVASPDMNRLRLWSHLFDFIMTTFLSEHCSALYPIPFPCFTLEYTLIPLILFYTLLDSMLSQPNHTIPY